MGIKPTYIKALSQELLSKNTGKFTNDFDGNKVVVDEVAVIDSKRVRNRVAGAITRKVNRKKVI
ncbi:small subunit ribosomal protein S17e [Methanomicrobium sp. W14]|jgi:small subunit ribosomal protein S17e|uniref:30S ribosomal protein S17e n=1 Tax=Methanomicrobium sp. W14 TaxID=2817839 RepID=UPI001AE71AAD|nr:30S ribosomal protein S17e [Methanomicrobium sp. W14]MBP2132559.1 small subunit ribosomal protein S17e [Methanomicrobium sp. W14]